MNKSNPASPPLLRSPAETLARHPVVRLLNFLLAGFLVAWLRSNVGVAVALIVALGLGGRAVLPRLMGLLVGLLPLLVLLPWSHDGGEFVRVIGRTLILATLAVTLTQSTPPHLLVAAAGRLAIPAQWVQLTLWSLRFIPLLTEEYDRTRIALRTRGGRTSTRWLSYLVAGLFLRSHDRAERVQAAVACRGGLGTAQVRLPSYQRTDAWSLVAWIIGLTLLMLLDRMASSELA
jgi:cobalt/nickel transport system permease protein